MPFGEGVVPFVTNVTNALTGQFYQFQPFADLRFRLAFADSVNISSINQNVNNNLGQVAINGGIPGLPPIGSFNKSITPAYSFNLTAVQNLLVDAMLHPLASFTFKNGSAAPSGVFNNTFGCPSLGSGNHCGNPVSQTITLTYYTGDTVDQNIFTQIASVVNNVSSTYNMGLTVSVVPIPLGQELTYGFSDQLYMFPIGGCCFADYPWVVDPIQYLFAPGGSIPLSVGWNLTAMQALINTLNSANSADNITGVIQASNQINSLSNRAVQYLWTFYPYFFQITTSNVQGFNYNSALYGTVEVLRHAILRNQRFEGSVVASPNFPFGLRKLVPGKNGLEL